MKFFQLNKITVKKLLHIEFTFSADYVAYVSEYLTSIKSTNDSKYDMLTNKNSKSLFYTFNNYLNRQNISVQNLRQLHGLLLLQTND